MKNKKEIVLIISVIILICGLNLLTFTKYEKIIKDNEIENLDIAFYKGNEKTDTMPTKDNSEGLVFIDGECDNGASIEWNSEEWAPLIKNLSKSKTKCTLYFKKQEYVNFGEKKIPVVDNGEGLYKVEHKDVSDTLNDEEFSKTEYRYAGKNPNNYVLFNDELWRIIGFVNVMTSEQNVEQRIKIIKDSSIGNFAWDSSEENVNNGGGVNEWSQSDIKSLLNDYYYNDYGTSNTHNCYVGDEATTNCNFQQTGLKEDAKSMIDEEVVWNTGATSGKDYTTLPVEKYYSFERGKNLKLCTFSEACNDEVERKDLWDKNSDGFHSIGLIYPSDYRYATIGTGDITRNKCLSYSVFFWSEKDECKNNDWLLRDTWTITAVSYGTDAKYVFLLCGVGIDHIGATAARGIYPVTYLKQNVKIVDNGNDGSKNNPYTLSVQ